MSHYKVGHQVKVTSGMRRDCVGTIESFSKDGFYAMVKFEIGKSYQDLRDLEIIYTSDQLVNILVNKGKGSRLFYKGNFYQDIVNYCEDEKLVLLVRHLRFGYMSARISPKNKMLLDQTASKVAELLVLWRDYVTDVNPEVTLINIFGANLA